jgi:Domain of unknown function (DUF4404)
MDNKALRRHLEQLNTELAQTPSLAPEDQTLLIGLIAEIQHALARSEPRPPALSPSVRTRLEQVLQQFEAEHPRLTLAVSQLLNTLAQGGV